MISKKAHKPILAIIVILSILIISIATYFVLADELEEQPIISRTATTDTSCINVPETRQIINENQCLDWDDRNWTDINCEQYNRKPNNNCNKYNNYVEDTNCSRHNIVGNRTNSSALGETPRSILTCIRDSNSVWDGFVCKDICSADSYCELTPSGNNETDYICIDNGYFDNYETDCNNLDGCSWSSNTCNFDVYDYSQDESDCLANSCGWENNNCFDDIENSTYCAGGYGQVIRDETINKQQCTKTLYSGLMNYDNGTEFVPIELNTQASFYLDYEYELTTAPYHAYFQDNIQAGKGFRFEANNYWFTYDLSGGKMQWAVENKTTPNWGKTKSIGSILSSSPDVYDNIVQYNDSFLNTDVQYRLHNELVKENFVLKSLPDGAGDYLYLEYTGEVQFDNNLTIWANGELQTSKEFTTSGRIDFKDSNNMTIYYLPVPVATDSNDSSVNLIYDIKPNAEKLTFGLKTPVSWLNNSSRVYPVMIDPTVKIYTPIGDGYVTYDGAFGGTASWGTVHDSDNGTHSSWTNDNINIWIRKYDNTYEISRGIITINTSSLNSGDTIINATLYVKIYNRDNDISDGNNWIGVVNASPKEYLSSVNLSDYNKTTTILGADTLDIDTLSLVYPNVWYGFELNDTGTEFINKGGISYFGLREGHDLLNISAGSSGDISGITIRSADYGEGAYLNLTYNSSLNEYNLTTCAILNDENGTYYLTSDITDSSTSNCMDITANNVVLDCQGHTIDGNDAADYGIDLNSQNNITIRNCSLTDWDTYAIYGEGSDLTIKNNSITTSRDFGIYLGGIGKITMINNSFFSNKYDYFIGDSTKNVITNNTGYLGLPWLYYNTTTTIENKNLSALFLYGDDNFVVKNTTIDSGTQGEGYALTLRSSDNFSLKNLSIVNAHTAITLRNAGHGYADNITLNNVYQGFYFDGSGSHYNNINNVSSIQSSISTTAYIININNVDYINITNITVDGNSGSRDSIILASGDNCIFKNLDLIEAYRDFIYLVGSNNQIVNGTIYGNYNQGDGIQITGSDNNITGLNISNISNAYDGYYGISVEGGSNNLIYNNFLNNTQNVQVSSGDHLWNKTKLSSWRIDGRSGYSGGNYYTNSSSTGYSDTCGDSNYDGICNVSLTHASGDVDYLPLSNEGIQFTVDQPTSGQTFTQDESTAIFNITTFEDMDDCLWSIDAGVTNYSMTNATNSTYWSDINKTMVDGANTANFWCNASDDGEWFEYPVGITFEVDSVNVTVCRDLGVENRKYFLRNDITSCSDDDCFYYTANNITLDGLGNKLEFTVSGEEFYHIIGDTNSINTFVNNSKVENIILNITRNGTDEADFGAIEFWGNNFKVNNVTINVNCSHQTDCYGIFVGGEFTSYNSSITNSTINVNQDTVTQGSYGILMRAENIQVKDCNVTLTGGNSESTGINCLGLNLTIKDTIIDSTKYSLSGESGEVFAINVSYLNNVSEYFSNPVLTQNLTRIWYFRIHVNDSSGDLDNAQVNIYNSTGSLVLSELTNSSGAIGKEELIEYINSGTKSFQTNHTINVSKAGYTTDSTIYNLTIEENVYHYVTLGLSNTAPTTTMNFPSNATNISSPTSFNCSATDTQGLHNMTLYLWNGSTITNTTLMNGTLNSTIFSQTLADGNYSWNCLACDNSTPSSSDWAPNNFTITIDSTNPTVTIQSPSDVTNTTDTGLDVTYTVTDTNLNTCWYSNDSMSANTTISCGTNITGVTWTQGDHNVTIWANDSAGNNASDEVNFFIDNINPNINITYPINNTYYNNQSIEINYTRNDTNLNACWYSNDSYAANTTLASCANISITWTDGQHNLTIWVNDTQVGNTNFSTIVFYIDSTNPLIDYDTQTEANDTNFSRDFIYVNLTITETNTQNMSFTLYNDTGIVNQTNYTSKILQINYTGVEDNNYTYQINITDKANNKNFTEKRTITLDDTAPTITIVNPTNATSYNHFNVTINYTITDNVIGLGSCWYSNDSGTTNYSTTCEQNFSQNMSEGTYDIDLWANDTLNNVALKSVTFTISTTAPSITLNDPTNNKYLAKTNVSFNYTATDTEGLSVCELYGNWSGAWHKNFTWNATSGVMNKTWANISEGKYLWNVWCNDTNNNGQFYTSNFTFTIDTTNPLIDYSAQTSANASNLSQTFLYVNVSITETNLQNITYSIYGTSGTINSTTYTSKKLYINWTGLSNDNNYTYQVNITDKANNKNFTEMRSLTLDTSDPTAVLSEPTNGTNSSATSTNFTVNLTDNFGLRNTTLTIYNTTGMFNQSNATFAEGVVDITKGIVVDLVYGIYDWFYEIWDWAGNYLKTGNYTVSIDDLNPNTTNSHFTPTTVYTENTVTIYGNMTDEYLATVWIEINYTGTYQNHTITNRVGDSYYYALHHTSVDNFENISWRWWANDSAGNKNSSTLMSVKVSNRPPYSVNITQPSNNTYLDVNSWIINFTGADTDSDTLNYSLYNSTDDVTYSLFNSTNTSTFFNFSNYTNTDGASHYFYITANDSRLQNQSKTYKFTIDKTNPGIKTPFTKPDESPTVICSDTNLELNYSVTDTNVNYCEFNVTTAGGAISTPHTTLSSCQNTTFNVSSYGAVQELNFIAYDKANNTNTTTRLIYVDLANALCTGGPKGGGGGGGVEEPDVEKTFCGDNLCQLEGNDFGLIENFWSCPQDCPGFNLDELIYAFSKNCWDNNNGTPCFWTQGFVIENISVCGNNICERDENFINCNQDCGSINVETLLINCFDDDESTPCFWSTNLSFYVIFGFFTGILALSFVKIRAPSGRKVSIPKYLKVKRKKWRRRL